MPHGYLGYWSGEASRIEDSSGFAGFWSDAIEEYYTTEKAAQGYKSRPKAFRPCVARERRRQSRH
jgi:hypothetical protein